MDSPNSGLPYSYAPLPNGDEPNGLGRIRWRPDKIGLIILSGLMVSALLISFLDYNAKSNVARNELTKEGLPESDGVPVKVSRGKAHGVSEKTNGLSLKGLRSSNYFDWNDLQLTWQRTSFHFQPQKNWMNGNFLSFFISE